MQDRLVRVVGIDLLLSTACVAVDGEARAIRVACEGADIELTADPSGERIVVTGAVSRTGAGESVRIEVDQPSGERKVVATTTGVEGQFSGVVSTLGEAGRYRIVARTFNSPNAADARSRPVVVDMGGGSTGPAVTWPTRPGGGTATDPFWRVTPPTNS